MGDGSEVFDDFLSGHPDPVIGDGESSCCLIGADADFPILSEIGIGKGFESCLIDGIGGIGDQFAEKDLFVRINRMDHHVQKLFDFCLKYSVFHKITPYVLFSCKVY